MGNQTSAEECARQGGTCIDGQENGYNLLDPGEICSGLCRKEPAFDRLTAKKRHAGPAAAYTREAQRTGQYTPVVGIGAILSIDHKTPREGRVYFSAFAPGSPCEEAARRGELQVGDILVQAEDQKITASSVYEVASLLLGPPGTVVQIKVKRAPASGYVGGEDELHHVVELERKQTNVSAMQALVEANRDPGAARSPAPLPPCDGASIVI